MVVRSSQSLTSTSTNLLTYRGDGAGELVDGGQRRGLAPQSVHL